MQQQQFWVDTKDQQRLSVTAWGNPENTAIVLVHGYPDNHAVWEFIVEQLVDRYYLIAYDVRGAGKSSIPKKVKQYQLSILSDDLMEVLDKVLPDRQVHLVAHDWGSIQTWESVTDPRFKDRVLSYSSMSGPCLDHAMLWLHDQLKNNRSKALRQLRKSWYIYLFHLPFVAPTAWHFFPTKGWKQVLKRLEKADVPSNENIASDGKYGVSLYRANFAPRLFKPRQRYAQCPVQLILLEKDSFVDPHVATAIDQWVDDLTISRLDMNHWAVLSHPQAVAGLISDYVDKIEAKR